MKTLCSINRQCYCDRLTQLFMSEKRYVSLEVLIGAEESLPATTQKLWQSALTTLIDQQQKYGAKLPKTQKINRVDMCNLELF